MISIPGTIPIRIHPFFWVLAFFIGWLNSFSGVSSLSVAIVHTSLWVIVITLSILVHEYGHALSAMAFGQRAKIDLVGFGGVTQRSGPRLRLWQEFIVVLCGPLFGLALALLIYFIPESKDKSMNLWIYSLEIAFYINVFWTVINLLPVQPLDGGHLFSIVLEGMFGLKGVKIAYFLSIILASVIGLFFFVIGWIFAGAIFLMFAFESYRSWQASLSMQEHDKDEQALNLFKKAEQEFHSGKKQQALEQFEQIRGMTQSGVLYALATQYSAQLLEEKGDYQKAYELLNPLKKQLDLPSLETLQRLAYQSHALKEAIKIGDQLFSESPKYEVAFINALAYAELGDAKSSVGWLNSAVRQGIPHIRMQLAKREFDSIRTSPEFQSFQSQLDSL